MEGITINKEQQVAYTQKEEGYVITSRDWKRIKNYIKKLKIPTPIWSNIAWGTLGIGVSCMVSWFTNRENVEFLVTGVFCIGVATCSFFASRNEIKHYNGALDNLKDIIVEIDEVMVPQGDS